MADFVLYTTYYTYEYKHIYLLKKHTSGFIQLNIYNSKYETGNKGDKMSRIWAFLVHFSIHGCFSSTNALKNCYQASSTVTFYTLELRGSVCFNITTIYIIQNYKNIQI